MTGPEPRTAPQLPADGPGPAPDPAAAGPLDERRPVVDGRIDDRGPEERRADIDELRGELGETVAELAHRLDVPTQLRARRDEAVSRAREQLVVAQTTLDEKAPPVGRLTRERPAVVGAVLALVPVLLVLRRRRRARRQ